MSNDTTHAPGCWKWGAGHYACALAEIERLQAAAASAHPSLEKAYAKGWRAASEWAKRDDLLADIGSPAYIVERDRLLAALPNPPSPHPEEGAGGNEGGKAMGGAA